MPGSHSTRIVLVTGCSSGIGRASAELLARSGFCVCATARRSESVDELEASASKFNGQMLARRLDVTDASTIESVVGELIERFGRIDVLINNAGYGQIGTVEDVTLDQWRSQFDTNLFGAVAMTQAVLPHMRKQGDGRIINLSSVVAHAALPIMSAYCASKHALEAMSTALRIETARFGIHVSVIEPGPIATQFRDAADATRRQPGDSNATEYDDLYRAFGKSWSLSYRKGITTPDHVAKVILKAVAARRPKARYRVTLIARILPITLALTPDRLLDFFALRLALRRQ